MLTLSRPWVTGAFYRYHRFVFDRVRCSSGTCYHIYFNGANLFFSPAGRSFATFSPEPGGLRDGKAKGRQVSCWRSTRVPSNDFSIFGVAQDLLLRGVLDGRIFDIIQIYIISSLPVRPLGQSQSYSTDQI